MNSRLLCQGFVLQSQEIFEEAEAGAGEDRLGVELDAFDAQLAVAKAHDGTVCGFGGNFERTRERFALDNQRVIARSLKILGEAAKDGLAIVVNFAGFSVHDFWRADYAAAECGANCLVAEANAENWNFPGEALDEWNADASFRWRARAGGDYDAFGLELFNFIESDLVIAADFKLLPHLAEVLRQVVGEGIVVVEKQNHLAASILAPRIIPRDYRCRRGARFQVLSQLRGLY
jgi:hypothetical protein